MNTRSLGEACGYAVVLASLYWALCIARQPEAAEKGRGTVRRFGQILPRSDIVAQIDRRRVRIVIEQAEKGTWRSTHCYPLRQLERAWRAI